MKSNRPSSINASLISWLPAPAAWCAAMVAEGCAVFLLHGVVQHSGRAWWAGALFCHLAAALVLMTVGLALKSALFPLHFWLPPAHASAPAPVSAALSALVVKAAFYLVLRLWFDLFEPVVTLGAATLLRADRVDFNLEDFRGSRAMHIKALLEGFNQSCVP